MPVIEFRAKIKNGLIEIPAHVQVGEMEEVQVILIAPSAPPPRPDLIEALMAQPLSAQAFTPLTREEAHARS